MVSIYFKPKNYSLCRTGLEVYRTDEDNFQAYVSSGVKQTTSSSSSDDSSSNSGEASLGYDYHQGLPLDTYYYNNLQKTSHESDYKEMNNNGSVTVNSINRKRFYKGIRVCLRKEWEAEGEVLEWDDLKPVLTGFITEQTFNESGVEIKLGGYSVLLDQKFQFEFSGMKRSKILEEIIKTAGLIPVINTKGLDDDVTDFKTSSDNNSSSSSALKGGEGEDIDSFVKSVIGSETDDLAKLKKLHSALVKKINYTGYECTRYNTPSKCLSSLKLNCADSARLAAACYRSAGLKCHVIHGDYHFWVIVTINGKDYASDVSGNHDLNEVWHTKKHPNTPFKGNNCGDEPDC